MTTETVSIYGLHDFPVTQEQCDDLLERGEVCRTQGEVWAYAVADETQTAENSDGGEYLVATPDAGAMNYCSYSGNYVTRRDSLIAFHNGRTVRITRSAYEADFFSCDSCDESFHSEHYYGEGICNDCAAIREEESREDECSGPIAEYHSEKSERMFGFFHADGTQSSSARGKARYYGLELEMEVKRGDRNEAAQRIHDALHTVSIQNDGSLDDGFEVIAPPMALNRVREFLAKLTPEIVRGLQAHNTRTCGMHVHVSRASLTPLQIGKLVVFLNAPENSAFITTIAQRDAGGYCKRKADKGKLTGLAACALARDDRYEALNLIPPHTVEFRIFKGTTRRDRAIKNIEFCAALCEYTETASLQSLRYTDFLAWLCKPEQRAAYATLYGFLTEQGRVPAVSKPKPLPSAKPLINTEGLLPVRQSGDGEQIDA